MSHCHLQEYHPPPRSSSHHRWSFSVIIIIVYFCENRDAFYYSGYTDEQK